MRFVVSSLVLNGDDEALILVDRLIDRLAEEAHRVEVLELDLLQESTWYRQARQVRRKVLMSALAKPPRMVSAQQGPHTKSMEVFDTRTARVADKLAHTPLLILVEDRESDGVLLDLIVEELGWPELRALWVNGRKITPRVVEIETAGGVGAIPQRIERIVADASEEGKPHRLFVLCDSDARWPGDSTTKQVVRDVCDRYAVPYYIWHKRCAENYIPDEVFIAVRDDPGSSNYVDRFDALLRRSAQQRDHFPVKDGMPPEERRQVMQSGLYGEAEEEDLKLLEKPLFPRRPRPILRLYRDKRSAFTVSGLRARDHERELDTVLQVIAQEL